MKKIKITNKQFQKVKFILEQHSERLLSGPYKCLEYTKFDIGNGSGKKMGRRSPKLFTYGGGDKVLEFSYNSGLNTSNEPGGNTRMLGEMQFQMTKGDYQLYMQGTFECEGAELKIYKVFYYFLKKDGNGKFKIKGTKKEKEDNLNVSTTKKNFSSLQDFENTIKNIKWK